MYDVREELLEIVEETKQLHTYCRGLLAEGDLLPNRNSAQVSWYRRASGHLPDELLVPVRPARFIVSDRDADFCVRPVHDVVPMVL